MAPHHCATCPQPSCRQLRTRDEVERADAWRYRLELAHDQIRERPQMGEHRGRYSVEGQFGYKPRCTLLKSFNERAPGPVAISGSALVGPVCLSTVWRRSTAVVNREELRFEPLSQF